MEEYLFVQYDKNKKSSLILVPILIKYIPDGKKVLCSLIAQSTKEGNYYDTCKLVSCHFANGSSSIQGVGFDWSYSPVAYYDSFREKIIIAAMYRLTSRICISIMLSRIEKYPFMKESV